MDFIITWSDGLGRVGTGEYLYDIVEKPVLGFDFDALYFETPTKLFIKLHKNVQTVLTEEEQDLCKKYCEEFYNSDSYMVHAIDPDLKTWVDYMSRGEMKRRGLEEAPHATFPDYSFVKWSGDKWERVVAAIDEEGGLWLLPSQDNIKFNFVFTEKEWEAFDKPDFDDQRYDFKEKVWKDARKFEDVVSLAKSRIRSYFLKSFSEKDLINYEHDTLMYMIQLREATNYLLNPLTSKTPFIDAVVSKIKDNKSKFIERIMKHYDDDILTELGVIHGEQQALLDAVSACSTVEQVDAVVTPLLKNAHRPWRKPVRIDPYAPADESF